MSTNLFSIQADIYKLESSQFSDNLDNYLDEVVSSHSEIENNYSYSEIPVRDDLAEGTEFKLRLYVGDDEERMPAWFGFVDSLVPSDAKQELEHLSRRYPSFLLFVYNQVSAYVIVKGAGRFVLNGKLEENFGISVLERIIDSSKADLRSADERGVIGSVIAQSRYFKRDHTINDDRSFSKFYKKIATFISKELLEQYLGISTERANLMVGGENSLKINTKVEIADLLERISKIELLLQQPKQCSINKFRQLSATERKRVYNGGKLENILEKLLVEQNYALFEQDEVIEIYHPSIFEYLSSSELYFYSLNPNLEHNLAHDSRITINTILDLFSFNPSDLNEFDSSLKSIFGGFFSLDSDEPVYPVALINWLTGEVEFDSKKYFRFDGKWYLYENAFVAQLNDDLDKLVGKLGSGNLLPNWNHSTYNPGEKKQSEHTYNLSLKNQDFVICDRGLLDGIEICDFFKLEGDVLNLYHVKRGFGQNIRVVYNQIVNAAKILAALQLSHDQLKLDDYFDNVKLNNYRGSLLDRSLFSSLLSTKKVKFTLVYGSELNADRNTEMLNSRSTIAKMCLLQCEYELRSEYSFEFDVIKVQVT